MVFVVEIWVAYGAHVFANTIGAPAQISGKHVIRPQRLGLITAIAFADLKSVCLLPSTLAFMALDGLHQSRYSRVEPSGAMALWWFQIGGARHFAYLSAGFRIGEGPVLAWPGA